MSLRNSIVVGLIKERIFRKKKFVQDKIKIRNCQNQFKISEDNNEIDNNNMNVNSIVIDVKY